MKGYKAFNKGLTCRGFQFEVGKTYKHDGEIGLCEAGFHFCKTASDCANHYDHADCEFAEIEAIGKVIEGDDKCVTDEIVIVGLISRAEFYDLANNGENNLGLVTPATGTPATGTPATGTPATGTPATGTPATGTPATVTPATGTPATGTPATGTPATGTLATGTPATGTPATVTPATGTPATVTPATVTPATGTPATGTPQTDQLDSFCTEIQTVKIFDVDTGKTYDELIKLLPEILWFIPFGYYRINDELKAYTAKDRQRFYDNLSDSEKAGIKSIPYFNADKFEKCTGINVED